MKFSSQRLPTAWTSRKQPGWCSEQLYIFIFIEFIISARGFLQRLVCGYEYVKLQGEIYLLTGSCLEGSVNFWIFFFFSSMHINKLLHNGGAEYPGVAFREFTHQDRVFFRAAGCQTSTGVFMILPANCISGFYFIFSKVKQQELQMRPGHLPEQLNSTTNLSQLSLSSWQPRGPRTWR